MTLPPTEDATRRALAVPERARSTLLVIIEAIGFFAQIALIGLGIAYIDGEDEAAGGDIATLILWCFLGTVYLAGTALWISLDLRLRPDDAPILRAMVGGRVARWISLGIMFCSSLVGLSAAIELVLIRDDPGHPAVYELAAVWAMLVSWALFHWGYARIYHAYFYRAKGPAPLVFPGTAEPRLSDFAYFAFTNGTSFSTNDVTVRTSRMRWTVVWHTTFSFFFNALIIVLTMNTIVGGLGGIGDL